MKLPLGAVIGARQVQPGRPLTPGQLRRGHQLALDGLAQHRSAQRDMAGGDGLHVDRHRQIGQGEGARFWRKASGACRNPVQHDVTGREFLDDDLTRQQRRLAPIQRYIADGQPDALIIGNRHLGHGGARRQRTFKANNSDHAAGIRQVFLKKRRQEILVGLLRRGGTRQGQQRDDPQRPHQNACPSPT